MKTFQMHGVPMEMRFWTFINILGDDDCWDWLGCINPNGYGEFGWNNKCHRAHRMVYSIVIGDPLGKLVCHSCDNRMCCNPQHLWLGTHDDNLKDAKKKGRIPRGNTHYKSLPWKTVSESVRLFRRGLRISDIARKMGISETAVRNWCFGKCRTTTSYQVIAR